MPNLRSLPSARSDLEPILARVATSFSPAICRECWVSAGLTVAKHHCATVPPQLTLAEGKGCSRCTLFLCDHRAAVAPFWRSREFSSSLSLSRYSSAVPPASANAVNARMDSDK